MVCIQEENDSGCEECGCVYGFVSEGVEGRG